jgi:prophage DNA circulation protein
MTQEARYTSPSGRETTFLWETGKRKTELKTGVYTFPGRDGAHVQHQGAGAKTFPLVCIFSGDDCMEKADLFEDMLVETGIAELQHPFYGTIKVVPTGDIEREDDSVNKLGESTVTVTFTETITDEESAGLTETAAETIDEKHEEFQDAAVSNFADIAEGVTTAGNISDITTQAETVSALEEQTKTIIDTLQPIALADKKVFAEWLTTANELKYSIKNLYSQAKNIAVKAESIYVKALNIGRLTLRLMKLPSTIAVSLSEKIKGYANLTANLINQYKKDPFGIEKMKAAYATASLAITGACAAIASGSALTIAEVASMTGATSTGISGGTRAAAGGGSSGSAGESGAGSDTRATAVNKSAGTASREEAVAAAQQISALLESVTNFQDTKIAQNAFVDSSPTSYLALCELVYSSVQLILNASFALPMQKTITLERDRQVIELCAELYGTVDYLDDFIIQNNFNVDEIGLLPMGKKVSYYVNSL